MKNNFIRFKPFDSMKKVLFLTFLIFSSSVVFSQPQYSISSGTTSNSIPTASASNQRQSLYLGSDFSTVPTGIITTLYLKANTSTAYSFTNFTVRMGNSSLTSMVAGPWITGLTTVFSGTPFAGTPGTGNWVMIPLQTPFAFDNTQNFIVEISQTGYAPGFNMLFANTTDRSIYGTSSGTTGSLQSRLPHLGFDFSLCTGTPTSPNITTPALTVPICSNTSTTITATNIGASSGVSYQWEEATSSTGPWVNVTGGSGATTLSYTTAPLTAATWFRVKATCGANSAPSTAYEVTVTPSPTPGAIAGNTTFCVGGTQVYSIAAVTGATSYSWTLPLGWIGASNSNTITATPNSTAGNVSVTITSNCGTSSPSILAVVPNAAPAQPVSILGNSTFCVGGTQVFTVIAITGATSYNWTLPPGWTGTSTTNAITATPNSTAGNVSVTAMNSCGTSASTTLVVVPSAVPEQPGTINGDTAVCANSSQTYSVPVIAGATSYTWTLPTGWVGTSTTNSITVTTGTIGGNITVTGSNNCGNSAAQTQAVTVSPSVTPTVSITATPGGPIVSGQSVTFTSTITNGGATPQYQWVKNATNISGETAATYVTTTLVNEDEISLKVVSDAECASVNEVTSNVVKIAMTTGLANPKTNGNKLRIYPNPSTGQFEIVAEFKKQVNGNIQILILNTLGQQIYLSEEPTSTNSTWSKKISLDKVANGIYLLRLTADDQTSTQQFEIIR